MPQESPNLQSLADDLRRTRDELRLKVHLARAEVRDDWVELERQWEHFRARLARAEKEAGKVAADIEGALSLLGEELKRGYQRIRKAL